MLLCHSYTVPAMHGENRGIIMNNLHSKPSLHVHFPLSIVDLV